ncbi:MAG: hypothetical protein AB8B95_11600 [Pseudohongiellaceae bacterium]
MPSIKKLFACITTTLVCLASTLIYADADRDANRLIQLSNVRELFENTRDEQTRMVLRTYASILETKGGYSLPREIREEIAFCYEARYDWSRFEDGIVDILLTTFSDKELQLLLDFFRNRSVPPNEISAFRAIVAKAEKVQSLGAEHIYNTTEGCIELGTQRILKFLRARG